MKDEGPELDGLLHRLAECPPEFLQAGVDVPAIVCDLLRPLAPARPPDLETAALAEIRRRDPKGVMLISVACWLLGDEWFMARPQLAPAIWKLLKTETLPRLAGLVRPEKFISDTDRREELVRTCLDHLGLRPRGELPAQAADRLTTLDSAERDRVLRATAAAERRAREIREAMARRQAQEAASRYGE
jgi:hypothetical protein